MKKLFKLFIVVLSVVFLTCACATKEGKEFKKEYEALNGKENASGKIHRTVSIPKDNPFIKVEASEIVKMIDEKETFFVYFGDELCPWCRSVIEKAIEVAKDSKVKKIYYVKIWDKDGKEILRDKYELTPIVTKTIEGTKDYYTLLEKFDSVLSEYTLTDTEGHKISVEEKRIFAPNFIYVENGVVKKLVEGISTKQTDSREELTKEMLEDEENIFKEFFNKTFKQD